MKADGRGAEGVNLKVIWEMSGKIVTKSKAYKGVSVLTGRRGAMLVSEILNKKSGSVITMSPIDSVEDAIGMFKEKKIGAVSICDTRGKLVDILTEPDVLHSQAEIGTETFKLEIEKIMSRVYICKPGRTWE